MQSILITGGNLEKRKEKTREITKERDYEIANIDCFVLEGETSIGIDKIRELEQWASRKPYSGKLKAAIILEAEKLTPQAQNALLKTLEEPPEDTLIVLTAPKESFLLPTIISRCKIIKLKDEAEIKLDKALLTSHFSLLTSLLKSRVGERIKKAESIAKTREETTAFLDQLSCFLRVVLLQKYQVSPNTPEFKNLSEKEIVRVLRKALKTKEMIKKNVNLKLALENFFLDLPLPK